jgi:hypothetical protein
MTDKVVRRRNDRPPREADELYRLANMRDENGSTKPGWKHVADMTEDEYWLLQDYTDALVGGSAQQTTEEQKPLRKKRVK